MKNWIEKLEDQDACEEGIEWASEYETPQSAWDACERADWMLWTWENNYGERGSESHRKMILCCVEIAKTSLKYIKEDDNKEAKRLVKKSLDTTERWAKGEDTTTLDDVKKSASAAAAWSAAAASVVSNAWLAAHAAARAAAATAATRENKLKEFADIIRKMQPDCPKFKTA